MEASKTEERRVRRREGYRDIENGKVVGKRNKHIRGKTGKQEHRERRVLVKGL